MLYDNRKTQEEIVTEGNRILNRLMGISIVLVIGLLILSIM
jgi:hypothetical protein